MAKNLWDRGSRSIPMHKRSLNNDIYATSHFVQTRERISDLAVTGTRKLNAEIECAKKRN